MEILRWKARLSVLWVFMAVGMSATMFLIFMKPGAIEKVMAGEIGGMQLSEGVMVFYALLWLIPLVMAVLCLTLNDSPNRWLNFVLGIVFGLFFILDLIRISAYGLTPSVAIVLMFIVAIVVAAFIAWFAWRWPKQEA